MTIGERAVRFDKVVEGALSGKVTLVLKKRKKQEGGTKESRSHKIVEPLM